MQKLLLYSLIISTIGIIILLIISLTYEPKLIKIKEVNSRDLEKTVKISGKVIKIINLTKFQIITLKDPTSEIKIITDNKNNIKKDQNLIIIGKIKEYNDSLEIEAKKIYITSLKIF